jgi:hypothetical protein
MRKFVLVAIAVLATGALFGSVAASAQSDDESVANKVIGYQDNKGVFHPLNRVAPDTTTPPSSGTIEVTITTTLKTAVPTGGAVYCGVSLTATSESLSTSLSIAIWEESASVQATVSAGKATCTVLIPYSWNIPPASATVMNSLSANYEVGIIPSTQKIVGTTILGSRTSIGPVPGLTKIPATSSTPDKFTVTATI